MIRLAILVAALLLPLSAFAQLEVFVFDGTNDTPLSALTSVGTVAPGDTQQTRFHIRNMGAGPASLSMLTLSGAGFTIVSAPSLPYVLVPYVGPASQIEFDITFSPEITGTFGAFLGVNSLNFALQGSSVLSASVTLSGSQIALTAGTAVNFGSVAVGTSQSQNFTLSNTSNASLTVSSVTVSGSGFSGPIGIVLPAQIGPGQSAPFQVIFTPQSGTPYQGTLSVSGRTFALTGQGLNAPAGLQLFEYNGTTDTPVPSGTPLNVGTGAPGDTITIRFHIRNNGDGPVVLQNIALSGTGFAIASGPSFPYTLSPYVGLASEPEIDVAFNPTNVGQYSATFAINTPAVNTLSLTLQGSGAASAVVTVQGNTLTTGAPVNFGSVDVGSTQSETFLLSNSGSGSITVSSISVSGTGFTMGSGLTLPVQIGPGQTNSFQVSFAPQTGASCQGTLSIDGRTFSLTGQGLDPLLPGASITVAGVNASGQQNTITILFDAASQISGTGTLQMSFQPSVAGATAANDPAIQFLPVPASKETVTIVKGATTALINGQSNMQFQTGTTAGTITFTLTLESDAPQKTTLAILPAVINLDSVTAVRQLGEIDVALAGFDNTYSASELAFTFYDLKLNAIPGGVISVDAASEFQPYFSSTQFGGMFQLLLKFPVTGGTAQIGFVTAGITNSAGTTTTSQPVAITN